MRGMLLATLLLAVLTGASACTADGAEPAAAPEAAPRVGTTLHGAVPTAVLDAPLVDSNGKRTSLGAMQGKVIVLSDVMTLCQESCPIITASMVAAARDLDRAGRGGRVEFVSLTIDPVRDDTLHLRTYQRQFGALPNWTVLGGSRRVVDRMWQTLGVWRHLTHLKPPLPRDWVTGARLTTDIAHTDELIFIDGHQDFRYEMEGYGTASPSSIPKRVYHFMDELGHRNVSAPDPGSWTPSQVTAVLRWVLTSPQ